MTLNKIICNGEVENSVLHVGVHELHEQVEFVLFVHHISRLWRSRLGERQWGTFVARRPKAFGFPCGGSNADVGKADFSVHASGILATGAFVEGDKAGLVS